MNKPNAPISMIMALLMIATPLAAMPFVVGEAGSPVQTPMFTGGDGSIGDPYWIVNVSDLQNMSLELDAHYILKNNIDASDTSVSGHWANNGGAGFMPIGDHGIQFTGTFDGQEYSISNLYINRPAGNPVGMFGRLGIGAYAGNTTLENSDITGGPNTAILVGFNEGTVENCSVYGIVDGSDNTGGVVGKNSGIGSKTINCFSDSIIDSGSCSAGIVGANEGTVIDCLSYGQISGTNQLGGVVGLNSGPIRGSFSHLEVFASDMIAGGLAGSSTNPNALIENCFSFGDVHVVGDYAGGLVGLNDAPISDSYSTGNVDANDYVGGFVGDNDENSNIQRCYSSGNVYGRHRVGGFIGDDWDGSNPGYGDIQDCYATGNVEGTGSYIGGFIGEAYSNIDNCYCTGNVTGSGVYVGGFDGEWWNFGGGITDCFWDNESSGRAASDEGTGLNTTDMMNNFTFKNAGWDFTNTWFSVNESTRPFLRMEWNTNISNSHQLQLMQMNLTADYTLANDINMDITNNASMWGTSVTNGEGFFPVANATAPFTGSLDGQGFVISDLFINRPSTDDNGLFGNINSLGVLTNIGFIDNDITGHSRSGALLGWNWHGTISNCYSTGTANGIFDTGGLVGRNVGTISNCYATGNIGGTNYVGGLAGFNYGGAISDSYATGDVSGTDRIGGLTGDNRNIIFNSYATGNVDGNDYVGGLTGYASNGAGIDISNINNCSSFGNVDGRDYVAGITGWTDVDTMFNDTHSSGTITGSAYVAGLIGRAAGGSGIISNSTSFADINGINGYTGGLVGMNYHEIRNSMAYGDVTADNMVGGLIGRNDGILTNSMAFGNVTGIDKYVGGLAGYAQGGSITDCIAYGNTSGTHSVGGLVGLNNFPVADCEAYGNVNGSEYDVGGLIGHNNDVVTGSESYGDVFGYNNNTGGLIGYNNGPVSYSTSFSEVSTNASNDNHYSTGGLIGQHAGFTVTSSEAYGNVTGCKFMTGGLIGHIVAGATVTNSSAYGITTGFGNTIGGLVGRNEGTISNSHAHGVTGDAVNPKSRTGGLAGDSFGLIQNSSASGDVFGSSITGGFAGENKGTIERCYSTGDVIATSDRVGGFVGWNNGNYGEGDIIDCYSQGNITGGDDDGIGGFVGNHSYGATITNVYSTGLVTGLLNTGGLVATNWISTVTDSHWDVETSGQVTSINGTGHNTGDMMQEGTFTNWDFTDIWGIHELLTYPFLQAIEPAFVFSADLELDLVPVPSNAPVGEPVIYHVSITNNGPCNALNVNVTLMGEGNSMDYVDNNQTSSTVWWGAGLSWEIAFLASGTTAWMQVNLVASESGIFYLNGTSISDISDPDTDNNDVSSNVTMNAPPVAADDSETIDEDSGANVINVLENDNDAEDDDLTITDITQGAHGTVTIIDSGKNVTYEPDADWNGEDSFNYTISDGIGTDTATVTIIVTNVNDLPVITTTDIMETAGGQPYIVDYNATDIDGDTLSWSLSSNASWMVISALTGELTGAPENANAGTYWVNVTVDDSNGGLDWTNFTLTVTGTGTTEPTDTDGDGVPDDEDDFPNDANETTDTDGDGVGDNADAFPSDPDEDTDTDGDGTGDNADAFPADSTEDTDTDGDGVGDNADAFPDDIAASVDADGDGYPDEWNEGYTEEDSTTGLVLDDIVDDDANDDTGSNSWLYIIIILVVVGAISGYMLMRGKGKEPAVDEPEEVAPEEAALSDVPDTELEELDL